MLRLPPSGCDPSGVARVRAVTGGVATLNPRLIAGIPSGWRPIEVSWKVKIWLVSGEQATLQRIAIQVHTEGVVRRVPHFFKGNKCGASPLP
jgi:hypothetical protein